LTRIFLSGGTNPGFSIEAIKTIIAFSLGAQQKKIESVTNKLFCNDHGLKPILVSSGKADGSLIPVAAPSNNFESSMVVDGNTYSLSATPEQGYDFEINTVVLKPATPTTQTLKSAEQSPPDFQNPAYDAEVDQIIDVDKLAVSSNGTKFIVRLNEISVLRTQEAMQVVQDYVTNKKLAVWRNPAPNPNDKTINADLWAEGSMDTLGDTLLRNGLAKLKIAEVDENLGQRAAMKYARENKLGMWARHN
jgi:endonuclease YncB( thermonuclease family)